MTDSQLYHELSTLPMEQKKQVETFIKFLKAIREQTKPGKPRKFGAAKGFFQMHKDFDEPLDDFKEYM